MSLSTIVMSLLADRALAGVSEPTGVPLGLAFGAGVLSTLNPCGFALLPAYVSYAVKQQVAASGHQSRGWRRVFCWSSSSQVASSRSAGACWCICSPGSLSSLAQD